MSINVTDNVARVGWSLAELAHATGVSAQTLGTEVREGRLRATRIRRRLIITRENWLAYTEAQRHRPEPVGPDERKAG